MLVAVILLDSSSARGIFQKYLPFMSTYLVYEAI